MNDLDRIKVELFGVAARWPVGTRVRHADAGWGGQVVPGTNPPGEPVSRDQAHCYVPADTHRSPAAVCVTWDRHPKVADWFRPEVLQRVGGAA